jgi:hypothetical protein
MRLLRFTRRLLWPKIANMARLPEENSPLLTPKPPGDMVLDDGLYVPKLHSKSHKEAILKDAGTAPIFSYSFLFGIEIEASKLASTTESIPVWYAVSLLSRIANHLAHVGTKSCAKDVEQNNFASYYSSSRISGKCRSRKRPHASRLKTSFF